LKHKSKKDKNKDKEKREFDKVLEKLLNTPPEQKKKEK
jgi:hypothetical protein